MLLVVIDAFAPFAVSNTNFGSANHMRGEGFVVCFVVFFCYPVLCLTVSNKSETVVTFEPLALLSRRAIYALKKKKMHLFGLCINLFHPLTHDVRGQEI